MNSASVLAVVGYAASVMVAISLMMTSILRLRVLNLIGSLTFAVYGYFIHAYPVAAVNLFIACINVYFIRQMLRTREFFNIVNVVPNSDYLQFFLSHNRDDIQRFMPGFEYEPVPDQVTVFVVRDLQPAGLLIGEPRDDGSLLVHLDYVIPGYRDLKIGHYLLEQRSDYFRSKGIRELVSPGGNELHRRYLRNMGFEERGADTFTRKVG